MFLLAACVVDNGLQKPGDGSSPGVDTGDTDTDIHADSVDSDTGSGGRSCAERRWEAEAISAVEVCRPPDENSTPLDGAYVFAEWEAEDPLNSESIPVVVSVAGTAIVAYADDNGQLRAVRGSTGEQLWSGNGLGGDPPGGAAWGDLNGDGILDAVARGMDRARAIGADGVELWSWLDPDPFGVLGAPALVDFDHDGQLEVVWGNRIYYGATGTLRGTGEHGIGSGCCDDGARPIGVVADIDLDGALDVVVGNALYDSWGDTLWYNGEEDGFVAVGNFDDDDFAEIVVSGNEHVRLQDDDGTVLWSHLYFPLMEEHAGRWGGGPPAIADLDADGRPEISVAGDTRILALEGSTGEILWEVAKLNENSGFGGCTAFDIDDDGDDDVISGDLENTFVIDGSTGAVLLQLPRSSGTGTETPVVADIDGDGRGELLVDGTVWASSGAPWGPARPVWNQHAFSLTNVEDDGTIPSYPEPNWLNYNSFRSATLRVPDGYHGPDLVADVVDVCQDECGEGVIVVWIRLANQGFGDVDHVVEVALYGTTASGDEVLLGSLSWTDPLPAGVRSASQEVRITGVELPLASLRVELDGGADRMAGVVEECDELNNVTVWSESVCE